MQIPRHVPITLSLARHCINYQVRAGLKDVGFSVLEDGDGRVWVTSSCENPLGCPSHTSAITDSSRLADEGIYLAVMVCTETLLARQSTIH